MNPYQEFALWIVKYRDFPTPSLMALLLSLENIPGAKFRSEETFRSLEREGIIEQSKIPKRLVMGSYYVYLLTEKGKKAAEDLSEDPRQIIIRIKECL